MLTVDIRKFSALFIFALLAACQSPSVAAQKDVPIAVVENFQRKYPAAKDVTWNIDRNGSHEAQFKVKDQKARADFNPDGSWIETEESINWKELPEVVQKAIEREFDKDDIVELEHTINAVKGEFYDVEIDPKGEEKFDIEYRLDGTVLGREDKD